MVQVIRRDHKRQTKTARVVIPELPPVIETDEDVIMLLFGLSGIDMDKLSRHPQMNYPNHVAAKGNQDIFSFPLNPEDVPTLQGLRELPVDQAA